MRHPILKTGIFVSLMLLVSVADKAVAKNASVQNAYARQHMSLDGQWDRIVDPYENGYYSHRYEPLSEGYFKNKKPQTNSDLVEYDFDTARKIRVPGDWNTQEAELFLYEGTVWYHKRFSVDKAKNKRYVLHFGAVNYKAIVYVNGARVGEHEGGFTAFQFDITDRLKPGDNFVIVKVDNRRERDQVPTVNFDWWNFGGITRPVLLLELPESYLADYTLHLNDGGNGIAGSVSVSAPLANGRVTLSIPELGIDQELSPDATGNARFDLPASPALWSPEQPKLYDVSLRFNGETVNDKVGFRSIGVDGTEILLNGNPIFLRGISIHEESPYFGGRAWSEADARTLLSWARELGCNFVRLAHYPHNETMIRMADEMGLLVWSEIPVYWTVMFDSPEVYARAEQQLDEMIARDKNRASVIMWSVANETPLVEARTVFLGNLVERARTLDPSRLITAAMDTQSNTESGKLIQDPLAEKVDVIGVNNYCGWYVGKPSECANVSWESHYEKPIIMSEMGAGALKGKHGGKDVRWSEEYQADVYINNLKMLEHMDALRGMTPWILKDFRSPRRPLTGIQDFWNRKGLLSEKGERKQAWYVLRDFYTQKAAQ